MFWCQQSWITWRTGGRLTKSCVCISTLYPEDLTATIAYCVKSFVSPSKNFTAPW